MLSHKPRPGKRGRGTRSRGHGRKHGVYRGITGAWFAKIGEENIQIAYCPECGKLLDPMMAKQQPEARA